MGQPETKPLQFHKDNFLENWNPITSGYSPINWIANALYVPPVEKPPNKPPENPNPSYRWVHPSVPSGKYISGWLQPPGFDPAKCPNPPIGGPYDGTSWTGYEYVSHGWTAVLSDGNPPPYRTNPVNEKPPGDTGPNLPTGNDFKVDPLGSLLKTVIQYPVETVLKTVGNTGQEVIKTVTTTTGTTADEVTKLLTNLLKNGSTVVQG